MKIYLQNLVKELKQFSESLEKQSILINKPWALIDSELGIQKLIFKKDNQLIMSKDGQVTTGTWEYLAEAKCLLIDRGIDKILCNENYIDDSILVLKIDGRREDFSVLANENNIPDLDAYKYLFNVLAEKANMQLLQLENDSFLQIKPNYHQNRVGIGSKVSINFKTALDGVYLSKDETQKFLVKNNEIDSIIYINKYSIDDNSFLMIETKKKNDIRIGCKITNNNEPINQGDYLILNGKIRLIVIDSVITNLFYIKSYKIENANILIEQKNELQYDVGDKVYYNDIISPDCTFKIAYERNLVISNGRIQKIGLHYDTKIRIMMVSIIVILFSILIIIAEIYNNEAQIQ